MYAYLIIIMCVFGYFVFKENVMDLEWQKSNQLKDHRL